MYISPSPLTAFVITYGIKNILLIERLFWHIFQTFFLIGYTTKQLKQRVISFAHRLFDNLINSVIIQIQDRKSTRLNSSHVSISYAVFCLKKKIIHKFIYDEHIYILEYFEIV